MKQPDPDNLTRLMIADLEHFGQSLWRNEEIGEKRFNFFLTLVTAIIGGLVALHTAKEKPATDSLIAITNGALTGILALGILTYLRMLHRNRVTDQYQRTLKHIRNKLLSFGPPSTAYGVPQPLSAGGWKWFRGGLAETVGTMNALLLFGILIFNSVGIYWVFATSLLFIIISWMLAAFRKGVS